ncbi:MAG: formylglycine-generating enzyme family protein, partial [Geminicoccaceae bacterium]
FKLFDMHGNALEWCADRYRHDHTDAPAVGTLRVVRGGSWFDYARYVRSAFRDRYEPGDRHDYLGFRCAGVQEES